MPSSLYGKSTAVVWTWLIGATLFAAGLLSLARISAAILIGALIAAIAVSASDGKLVVPAWPYRLAQALIGCLIARSLNVQNLHTILAQWPTFLLSVGTVIVFSALLGGLLARFDVLPGTTAVWGSAPGAASVMTLMSEAYGADVRMVAFMQFLRVAVVALCASLVSVLWAPHGPAPARDWFPALEGMPFAITLGVAMLGALASKLWDKPGSALLLPMLIMALLAGLADFPITLPPWLLALSYALLGWAIGARFTREIVLYTASAFGKVLASILTLVALCGGLAYVLHLATGMDPLTAYLATSPGGADSVAIIAASSSQVDLPFVTAMQTTRFLVVLVVGPALARFTARWSQRAG
ncbi:MAG: AbrB family transcriptional regulator [Polyangiales bacterium]